MWGHTWWRAALSGGLGGWLEPFPGRTTTRHRLPAALTLFKRAIAAIEKVSWREKGQNTLRADRKRWLGKGISNESIGLVEGVRRKLSDHWQLAIQGEKRTGSGWDPVIKELSDREGWGEKREEGKLATQDWSAGENWEWSVLISQKEFRNRRTGKEERVESQTETQ